MRWLYVINYRSWNNRRIPLDEWEIITDYIISESSVIDLNCNRGNRALGNLRRTKLFKDGNLISEASGIV